MASDTPGQKFTRRGFLKSAAAAAAVVAVNDVLGGKGTLGAENAVAATVGQSSPNGQRRDGVWSFGVISDTQWTVPADGYNPNTSALNIVKQVNEQFIKAGVKLVVAVGDTVDVGSATSISFLRARQRHQCQQ